MAPFLISVFAKHPSPPFGECLTAKHSFSNSGICSRDEERERERGGER